MKQTAVEWFVEQLSSYTTTDGNIISHHQNITHLFEQAKAMEKQQAVDFAYEIADDLACDVLSKKAIEDRYNEFFKSE
jgi:hypothetical protein